MRQIVPFTKNIEFKTMINEITNITLEHNLSLKDEHNISGDFLISGKYKINQSSPTEESFSYKIPIDIDIDKSYKTNNIELEIDDFKYEKSDSNKLKVDIDLSIDNLEKIETQEPVRTFLEEDELEIMDFDDRKILSDEEKQQIDNIITGDNTITNDNTINLFQEMTVPQKLEVKETYLEPNTPKEKPSVGSLFEVFKDADETFSTYSVYIVRNGDNVDDIISKYKTTREKLKSIMICQT